MPVSEGKEIIVEPPLVIGITGTVVPELSVVKLERPGIEAGPVAMGEVTDAAPVVAVPPPFRAVETSECRADDATESWLEISEATELDAAD